MITFTNAIPGVGPAHVLRPTEALFVLPAKITVQSAGEIECTQIVFPGANLFVKEPVDQVLAALGAKSKASGRRR